MALNRYQLNKVENYLASVRALEASVKRYEQEAERIRVAMEPKGLDLTKERVQGHTPDNGAQWDKLLAARRRHDEALCKLIDRRARVLELLDQMDDPLLSDLLYERYMSPVEPSWEQLADRFNYSSTHIYRMKDAALNSFSEISQNKRWEEMGRNGKKREEM